jgi:AraC-like DNA-binding protein
MRATNWSSDLAYYHDSYDLCLMDAVSGNSGPRNIYRRWCYEATPGDVLVFEPGNCHRAVGGPQASYRVLLLPEATVRRVVEAWSDKPNSLHFKAPTAPTAYRSLRRLCDLLEQHDVEPMEIEAAFLESMEMVLAAGAETSTVAAVRTKNVRRALECIEDLLNEHPERSITLTQLAKELGEPDRFRLHREFARAVGVPPGGYIKLRKLARAKAMLLDERRSVRHIAWDHGYTAQSFARAFRGQYGTSARRYRSAFALK